MKKLFVFALLLLFAGCEKKAPVPVGTGVVTKVYDKYAPAYSFVVDVKFYNGGGVVRATMDSPWEFDTTVGDTVRVEITDGGEGKIIASLVGRVKR